MEDLQDGSGPRLTLILQRLVGTIVLVLRKPWFETLDSWQVSTRISVSVPSQVAIGRGVSIEPYCVLDGHSTKARVGISIGAKTKIMRYVIIKARGGFVNIGSHCSIQDFCKLTGGGGISIGDNVRIASHTTLVAAQHVFTRRDLPIRKQGLTTQGIVVEDDVWIGAGVCVLDGVTIGTGSVIGAGAVVNRSIPPFSIAVGVPAKVVGQRAEAEDRSTR